MTSSQVYKLCFAISAIGVVLLIMIPSIYIDALPDRVPMHYGADGVADRFGDKSELWSLPVIGGVLFAVLALVGYFLPQMPHDAKKNTLQTHNAQMHSMTSMLGIMNIAMTYTLVYITYRTVLVAQGDVTGLGKGMLPISMVAILGPMAYYCWKMYQAAR